MSIRRGPRPETRFYTLDKSISEDSRLSWAARGMLIFLLGKPDNWDVSVAHLIAQTKGCIGNYTGRDGVRAILKELEAAGYLKADIARQDAGKFGGMDYVVSEVPAEVEPSPKTPQPAPVQPQTPQPATAQPATAQPAPANPPLTSNEFKQCTETAVSTDNNQGAAPPADAPPTPKAKAKPKPKPAKVDPMLPDWIPEQPWLDFVAMRVKIKAPLTEAAMRLAINKLEALMNAGHAPEDVLNQSTMNSWKSIYPVKDDYVGSGMGINRQEALEARNARAAEQFINGDV